MHYAKMTSCRHPPSYPADDVQLVFIFTSVLKSSPGTTKRLQLDQTGPRSGLFFGPVFQYLRVED